MAHELGHSLGSFGSTIRVLVNALGNPLKFRLTSGAAGDNPQAIPLLDGCQPGEVSVDRGTMPTRPSPTLSRSCG